jgi:hypothetical protein
MNRSIRSLSALLLAALLLAMPTLSLGQEPIKETPPVVFDNQTAEEKPLDISNSKVPLVQIHTMGSWSGRHLLSVLEGRSFDESLNLVIGELSGFGTVRIDDQTVQGGKILNGSRVQVGRGSCARAELGNLGQISMAAGSDLSIAADSDSVYAKLNSGSIKIDLPAGISGVVEAANKVVMNLTDSDISFTVRMNGDQMVVEAPDGYVVQDQLVDNADDYQIAFLSSREEKMRPNHSLEIQVKVTDKQQRPRPGTTVLFSSRDVSGNVNGTFSQTTAVTDSNGIARTSVSVGPNNGKSLISASVPGTTAVATMTIKVQGGFIFGMSTMQTVTLVGVAAAGAIGVQQGVSNANNGNDRRAQGATGNQIEVIGRD